MLDAACPGAVFTSPVPDQMLAATRAVNGGAGVLHIVKNYTGDVLNFEMAAELAQADGIQVASVTIDDDVAVKDSLYTAGRRGVGATVLAEKIAGAAAAAGASLERVADLCRKVNAGARSMGMALTSCTVPAAGKPTFELGDDEMEIGIGIHGEPGRTRVKLAPAATIAEMLLSPILEDLPFRSGDTVLAFVNGMGERRSSSSMSCITSWHVSSRRRTSPLAATWSAATSRHWKWPDAPSPCSSLTMSSLSSGMLRSIRRRCAGAHDPLDYTSPTQSRAVEKATGSPTGWGTSYLLERGQRWVSVWQRIGYVFSPGCGARRKNCAQSVNI
jgi:hypothetical protein